MSATARTHLRVISVPASPYCELARWTMDRRGIAYIEQGHVPGFHIFWTRRAGGGADVPVTVTPEGTLRNARELVQHVDARTPRELRLLPAEQPEAVELFDYAYDTIGIAVRAWAYAYMLPVRASTLRVWATNVTAPERLLVRPLYPLLARTVGRTLRLDADTIPRCRAEIDAGFERLDALLADGRRYLAGGRLTGADLALASLTAPALLPPQYRGPQQTWDEMPPAMREDIERWRTRPTARFVYRLYQEERAE